MIPRLTEEEAVVLRTVLNTICIRQRTGELGIIHGYDRFVSTNICFKKQHLQLLASAAKKVGAEFQLTQK